MANPTGTTYLQANANYIWANGDVYEIQQTDEIEGANAIASFSGLGVDNQPHQFLLDKANYIHAKQLADEATIGTLLTSVALFSSAAGPNGYIKVPTRDANLGAITFIFQWGTIEFAPFNLQFLGQGHNNYFRFDFPIPFTNAVWLLSAYFQTNSTTGQMAFTEGATWTLEAASPLQLATNRILVDWNGSTVPPIVSHTSQIGGIGGGTEVVPGLTGIGWIALGY